MLRERDQMIGSRSHSPEKAEAGLEPGALLLHLSPFPLSLFQSAMS